MQDTQEKHIKSIKSGRSSEEEMETYSNILAWRISWTEEPGGLQSMGLQRIEQDSAHAHTHIHIQINIIQN